ncbi:hypothetical protein GCM10011579_095150 [Streptomyces albiflavescens]|uniref:Uncharacterized protein n=1 Tax=Streptomyces albiflavescens TaxID=1623582 RepID=A0A917YEU1_9ACTN|nr:hypothetical protein GCM10011579_095150 [Streptomyces albiflavescens]
MGVLIGMYEPHKPKAGGGADRFRWEEALDLLGPEAEAALVHPVRSKPWSAAISVTPTVATNPAPRLTNALLATLPTPPKPQPRRNPPTAETSRMRSRPKRPHRSPPPMIPPPPTTPAEPAEDTTPRPDSVPVPLQLHEAEIAFMSRVGGAYVSRCPARSGGQRLGQHCLHPAAPQTLPRRGLPPHWGGEPLRAACEWPRGAGRGEHSPGAGG